LTWDKIEAIALGEMAMPLSEFYDMTPREFANKSAGYFERIERDFKTSWEQSRWLAAIVINPHLKRPVKPADLAVFEWEKTAKKTKQKQRPTRFQLIKLAEDLGILTPEKND
jgi:hypothetical protein